MNRLDNQSKIGHAVLLADKQYRGRRNAMEPVELVSIVVAILLGIYGAGLSTFLALRERQREKRKINAHLEYAFVDGRYQLVILNTGFRPVTVTGVSLDYYVDNEDGHWFPVEYFHIFDPSENYPFPVTLSDGEHVALTLNDFVTQEWVEKNRLRFFVYDTERHSYRVDTTHAYKLGYDPGV